MPHSSCQGWVFFPGPGALLRQQAPVFPSSETFTSDFGTIKATLLTWACFLAPLHSSPLSCTITWWLLPLLPAVTTPLCSLLSSCPSLPPFTVPVLPAWCFSCDTFLQCLQATPMRITSRAAVTHVLSCPRDGCCVVSQSPCPEAFICHISSFQL